jgi:hypothetical protein
VSGTRRESGGARVRPASGRRSLHENLPFAKRKWCGPKRRATTLRFRKFRQRKDRGARGLSLVYPREARLAQPVQAVIRFVLDVMQENAARIAGTAS